MINERKIGKIISVDSFRVFIKLDDDLKSLYKSGFEDIYEVARINSYIIIPIGSEKIVALVTRVRAIDETEISKDRDSIFLTDSSRYLVATMIGTITSENKYIQGVYNYPILDNPVWYVVRQELDIIFDQKAIDSIIDFSKDYYLPIGTSPSFTDYKIKINPDKFFGKHAAILGNTGSGKSCTLSAILQSLFNFEYNSKKLQSAHIIIFDTNGEYKDAFIDEASGEAIIKEINPFYIDKKGIKVPYWFMNFDDFDYLFEPTSGTQAPIFKRSLSLAKSIHTAEANRLIPQSFISKLQSIINECDDNDFKIKGTIYNEIESFIADLEDLECDFNLEMIIDSLNSLLSEKSKLKENRGYFNGYVNSGILNSSSAAIRDSLNEYINSQNITKVTEDKNIDLPIWFSFRDLITKFFDEAIQEQDGSSNRIKEYVSTLKLRLQSYLNDDRIASPLLLKKIKSDEISLANFLSFIIGDFVKVYSSNKEDLYSKYYSSLDNIQKDSNSQVTIIDMSLLPSEVLETITGLIGRLILEFVSRFPDKDRAKLPVVLALEEAQNYIPEKNKTERESISKRVFERIAREGRKYGLSLIVSSQRPSELSKTVLSQCNSFIIHRLQNPEDQKYVRQLVSAANEDILQQLPILPQQHVVIMGDAVRTPVQAKMNDASPIPNSRDPKFIENWLKEYDEDFPDYKGITEAWEKGEKIGATEEE